MDEGRFDALTRALGAARSRRGAIGALAALFGGAVMGVGDADARRRRRRRRCKPKCPAGQTCDRDTRTCTCDNGGTVCGANCCLLGQTCEGGQCVSPGPGPACHPLGEACVGDDAPCCGDDLICASGQGGKRDVACYRMLGAACASDTDCTQGARCDGGACALIQPPPVQTCDSGTCSGCCAGTSCVPVASQHAGACGTGGAACAACGVGTGCFGGACLACGSATCPNGCCFGAACVPFASQTSAMCGTGGATCSACPAPNTACNTGTGTCQLPTACDAVSCAAGCCQGSVCVLYAAQGLAVCGRNGAPCAACPGTSLTCTGGLCFP